MEVKSAEPQRQFAGTSPPLTGRPYCSATFFNTLASIVKHRNQADVHASEELNMSTLSSTERTSRSFQGVIGRSYQPLVRATRPAPLAGVASPWHAGTFLDSDDVAGVEHKGKTDAELGEAIFRFVFERY
jgi:hypothetical protein